ncbi:MAG: transporter substrate-binding domain-containing protein [Desulfoarculaceae bacterium]|nr:transporter substrate-binding domain-containing protein [Desulfoarculaceae bacterium]
MQNHSIRPFLTVMALLFFISLSGCGPNIPEYVLPTSKISPDLTPPVEPAPAVIMPVQPEPLADPEIAASPEVLRVGISRDQQPFIYRKNQKIQGLEGDLAQQLGKFSGKAVYFIKVPEERATEALEKGYIDMIIPGRKISGAKDAQVTFSEPYLRAGQILLIRSRDVAIFSNGIYSLEGSGFTFGVIEGSSGDQFITKTIQGVIIRRFKTAETAVQALIGKDIDLFLHDAPTICHHAAINKSAELIPILNLVTEEYIGWEMRSEDKELRQQANLFIRQSRAEGRLQKTIRQWIPNL